LVQQYFSQDPLTGHLFLFLNRRRDRIKILYFDRDGLAIWYKRLEAGSFQLPQTAAQDSIELQPAQLAMLLSGIDLRTARQRKRFQRGG
jgi:transposase